MSIGDNIRTARINKGLNQKELAEMLTQRGINVGNTTISNWENGTSKPDPDTIEEICKLLDVDGNFILGFSKEQLKDNVINEVLELFKEKGLIDDNGNVDKDVDQLIDMAIQIKGMAEKKKED